MSGLPLLGLGTRRRGKNLVWHGTIAPAFIVKRDERKGTLTVLLRDKNGRVWEVETPFQDLIRHHAGQIEVALHPKGKPEKARLHRALDWKANTR